MQDLRTVRESKRLSQQDLSELSGVSQPHLSALERGQYLPNKHTRLRIQQLMGSQIDWQLTITGDREQVTRMLLEMINVQADGVLARIAHVRRILHEIEKSLQTQ